MAQGNSKQLTVKVRLNAVDFNKQLNKMVTHINKISSAVNKVSNNSLPKIVGQTANASEKIADASSKVAQQTQKAASSAGKIATEYNRANIALNASSGGVLSYSGKVQMVFDRIKNRITLIKSGIGSLATTISGTLRTGAKKFSNDISEWLRKYTKIPQLIARIRQGHENLKNVVKSNSSGIKSWINHHKELNNNISKSKNLLSSVGNILKRIATTYLGIMGARALINTSDTITKAKNKLNYVNSQNGGDPSYTQESMDKMYASAQRVNMSYTEMMSNVSKSMTLAGDAFQNNTDAAIRFQEIMSEAYTVGGASVAEMNSSMYQLIQALGAGTLAGDELRSVREGAPLAYKEIEKFVQGVYDTEESLKDLASEGKVTSEMVVAAIMQSGEAIDEAFQSADMTFEQFWQKIKNSAVKAFEPISDELNKALNELADSGILDQIDTVFTNLSKVILIAFKLIVNGITWIADNWETIRWVVGAVLGFIVLLLVKLAVHAIWTGLQIAWSFMIANWWLILIVLAIIGIIYAFTKLKDGTLSMTNFLVICAAIIATAFLIVGIVIGNIPMIVIAAIVLVVALAYMFFEQICGGVMWLLALLWNIIKGVINLIIGIIFAAGASILNSIIGVINAALSFLWTLFVQPFIGIIEWILNACNGGFNSFGGAVANLIGQIIGWFLSLGKVVTTIIDAIFGTNWTGGLESLKDTVTNWGKSEKGISIENSVDDTLIKSIDTANAFKKGFGTIDFTNMTEAYNTGAEWGADKKSDLSSYLDGVTSGWGDSLLSGVDGLTSGLGDKFNLDSIGESLGLDFSGLGNPSATDPSLGVADAYKIAAQEWKREYTTATITVDMSNYNTVNGDDDLDGICTKLADKLYSEMDYLANGVY